MLGILGLVGSGEFTEVIGDGVKHFGKLEAKVYGVGMVNKGIRVRKYIE